MARIELGAQGYDQDCTLDGRPTVALSVYQRPGSNALETARLVRAKMEELKGRFPEGVDYTIAYDTTPFIVESVDEVFNTLRDAVILVAFVVLLFLQNWRSALIPLVAVPVAIVGTFAIMAALGFSLNNLTLFGLVLAIGIVVNDAIVVVEAVEHHIEHGLAPREATIMAMNQVSSPVIAVGLVLTAVFVPCAFISGITGQFYRQFALDHCDLDGDLGIQLADLEPGPFRSLAPPAAEGRVPGVAGGGVRRPRRLGRLHPDRALPFPVGSRTVAPGAAALAGALGGACPRRSGWGLHRMARQLGPQSVDGMVLLPFQQGF